MNTPAAVFSFEALWAASCRAMRGKRHRDAVARFRLTLEDHLLALRDALRAGTWTPSRPRLMRVFDPKPRTISVLPFADRVVHQCLDAVYAPRLERRMITDSYACRVGAGAHAAARRARDWSRTWRWCVHLDVARYFPSIDHAIVRAQIGRDVPEPWLREVLHRILDAGVCEAQRWHHPGDDLFTPFTRAVGLPLGSLTSQRQANRYLDPVDHLVKDRLRHRGYLRYMDDMLLFDDDRTRLTALARRVEDACHALRLRLHPWDVRPTRDGVSFVGYRTKRDHVRVRRSTVARAERRLRLKLEAARRGETDAAAFWHSLRSTFGHWSHADTWRMKERLLGRLHILDGPLEPWIEKR